MKRLFYGEVKDGEIKFDDLKSWEQIHKEYAGQSIEISIQPLGKRRNTKQNRFYWKVVVNELSLHFGYTTKEMHKALKIKFDIDSTSTLSVLDFSKYIESVIRWAEFEQGFILDTTRPLLSED
jgi:hypothetical protein